MTKFELKLTPFTGRLLAVVATHGITDVARPRTSLLRYAAFCITPLPSYVTTLMFCTASVLHLSLDVGHIASLILHMTVAAIGVMFGASVAFNSFIIYFFFVHVPCHYHREIKKGNNLLVLLSFVIGVVLASEKRTIFVLNDMMQKVVIAHIWSVL